MSLLSNIEQNHAPVEVIGTVPEFDNALEQLVAGSGPIAADVERASGFRYGQKPYLIQLFRRDSGVFLIDPVTVPDLSAISQALPEIEWVLHAAHQDLENIFQVGLSPQRLFDTEVAAKFIGAERFGLASLLEDFLNISLEKKYSAVDWSTRPLPHEWLVYAALDVEYLLDLADVLKDQLVEVDRLALAKEAFNNTLKQYRSRTVEEPHPERWRRLSGIHRLRSQQELAIARSLWFARDELAIREDIAPGRLIPDRSIIHIALTQPNSFMEFVNDKQFTGQQSRTQAKLWWSAYLSGKKEKQLPDLRYSSDEVPPLKAWKRLKPEAHRQISALREEIFAHSAELGIPHELVITPKTLRDAVWQKQHFESEEEVAAHLSSCGVPPEQLKHILPIYWQVIVDIKQNPIVSSEDESDVSAKD